MSFVHAQNLPAAEKQKIEALIKQVGDLKDAKFVRNGSTYEPATAVRFLRGKWDANKADVKSVRDFIDKVATKSGTSGKPYLMRLATAKKSPAANSSWQSSKNSNPKPPVIDSLHSRLTARQRYAPACTRFPFGHLVEFHELERTARASAIGAWASCPIE